ncbi:cohesin complex subunit [Coemansia sp. RSA 2610]|nr:cohesin complex subunit [Coemansia sp. RSA 2610]
MTTTPRRSARVAKVPERLTPSTTPRKRANAGKAALAFPLPRASNKRQKTGGRRQRARAHVSDTEDEGHESGSANEDSANEASANEASANEASAASPSSEEGSDFDEPQRRRAKAPRKAAAKSKKQSKLVGGAAASSQLLDALSDEKAALTQIAADWIESYREDSEAALCELINLIVRLTGCPTRVPQEAVFEASGIGELLEELQAQTLAALRQQRTQEGEYDDLLAGRTKEQRRQRRSVLQFVRSVVVDGQHHVVFGEASAGSRLSPFSEVVLQWLATMGGASYRPFRHVSTLVALAVQSALASVRAHIGGELQTAQRQLEADARASKRRGRGQAGGQLRARVAALSEHDELAAAAFQALYDTVFIYRYRDVHAMVRAECLVPLAAWCRAHPAAYLKTEYLRYFGWALNDRDARVREAAVVAITGPLLQGKAPAATPGTVGSGVGALGIADAADKSVAAGLRPFVVRFLPRLVQVAAGDVDQRVQVAALRLVTQLARLQYIDAGARVGDIRRLKPQKADKARRRSGRGARPTYSSSLSQQMLEESSDDAAEDSGSDAGAADPAFDVHVLDADDARTDSAVLGCPRHTVLRYLAPLVTHTNASVRAAAAELVAWWLRDAWVPAARIAALGIDGDGISLDADSGNEDDEDDEDDDAPLSLAELQATPARRARTRRRLVFRAVGAFLVHVSRGSQAGDADMDVDVGADAWVAEQAAACIEEAWAAPAGLSDAPSAQTALDRRIAAAVGVDQTAVPAPRLVAAAQALWARVPELGRLHELAAYLAWDHSAGGRFALAPAEETALLQALAVWVGERAADRRARSKKERAEAEAGARELARLWQGAFVRLLARNMDSAERLLPLVQVAAEALDLQLLFDAHRTDVVADAAARVAAALERYGGCVRLARLAVQFLGRVDDSRVLRADAQGEDLIGRAAARAASQFGAAVALVPETPRAQAAVFADVYAHAVALRALVRVRDVSAHADAAAEQALRLVELAARSSAIVQTVPEKAAVAALDVAYHFVLWHALRLDRQLQGGSEDAEPLRVVRDRIVDVCAELADAGAAGYGRLRDHAFMVLGRVLRLFSGSLVRGSDARRALALAADHAGRAQLAGFLRGRLDAWARLLAADADEAQDEAAQYYAAAPSAWGIAYGRVCALAALWAQWLGDQTVPIAWLGDLAAHTGLAGLEQRGAERGRRQRAGFVALSAFDHIVQAAVDAAKPQLAAAATRERGVSALVGALRAAYARHAGVNVATLARFVSAALRTGAEPQTRGRRGEALLAPAALGAAWAQAHEQAIEYGLAQAVPEFAGADVGAGLAVERGAVADDAWEARAAPWFAALAQTVAGVVRPRHAEALDAHLARCCEMLGLRDGSDDAEAAAAAVAPYQRALDRELAKRDAIRARMADVLSPPVSPAAVRVLGE